MSIPALDPEGQSRLSFALGFVVWRWAMTVRMRSGVAGALALEMAGVALAAGGYSIVVNGQAAPRSAVVIKGEPYVPLSALKGLGSRAASRARC